MKIQIDQIKRRFSIAIKLLITKKIKINFLRENPALVCKQNPVCFGKKIIRIDSLHCVFLLNWKFENETEK